MFVMERAQVLVAVDKSQTAIVTVLKLGMILLPVEGAPGLHDPSPKMSVQLFLMLTQNPCRAATLSRVTMMVRMLWDCIVGIRGDGEDGEVMYPSGAIQTQLNPSVLVVLTPSCLQRIAVEVLHADREKLLNQALAQFLDEACHARVEDQVGTRREVELRDGEKI